MAGNQSPLPLIYLLLGTPVDGWSWESITSPPDILMRLRDEIAWELGINHLSP